MDTDKKERTVTQRIIDWFNVRTNGYFTAALVALVLGAVAGRTGHVFINLLCFGLGCYFWGRRSELNRVVAEMEASMQAMLGAVAASLGINDTKPALRVIKGGKDAPKDPPPPTARAAGFHLPHTGDDDLDENFKPRNPEDTDGPAA